MPLSFFEHFLPQVFKAGKDWTIFYEVKSNMRRAQVDLLAAAGVRWIQPGIESLSDHVLKLMRKGVSTAQNVQTLRYSAERGVTVSWNLISDFPMETSDDYRQMAKLFPRLHHLDPPSGIGPFEVHRFSPFYEDPQGHGIYLRGPHRAYESVFPVDNDLLARLVYRFEYDLVQPKDPKLVHAHGEVATAIREWKHARSRRAKFEITVKSDGSAMLTDTRVAAEAVERELSVDQLTLLRFLDEMRPVVRAADTFAITNPDAFRRLGGSDGIARLIDAWHNDNIIIIIVSGYAVSLPVDRDRFGSTFHTAKSHQVALTA